MDAIVPCAMARALSIALMVLVQGSLHGQWIEQRIVLKPGWNAVQVEVILSEPRCDTVFGSLPTVTGVWRYARRFSTVEFTEDIGQLLANDGHWLRWLPPQHPERFLSTLTDLQGGYAYLIEVAAGAAPMTLTLVGEPVLPQGELIPGAMNLVGLPVNPFAAPTLAQALQDTVGIAVEPGLGSAVYTVGSDGRARQVLQTTRQSAVAGQAYWLRAERMARHLSAVTLSGSMDARGCLDFGTEGLEHVLNFHNQAVGTPVTVELRVVKSAGPPPGGPVLIGAVPLSYFYSDITNTSFGWREFSETVSLEIEPESTSELRIGLRRADLEPYSSGGEAVYAGLLEVLVKPYNWRYRIAIRALPEAAQPQLAPMSAIADDGRVRPQSDTPVTYHPAQGLWLGEVTLDQVQRIEPVGGIGDNGLQATPLPFRYPLLVHVNRSGEARLLQHVLVAWSEGVDSGQTLRLYADEANLPEDVTRVERISSAALPVMEPCALTGIWGAQLQGDVTLGYDDPVNPFKHAFHPDHDNKDAEFSPTPLPEGVESWSVERQIMLDFAEAGGEDGEALIPQGPVIVFAQQGQEVQLPALSIGSPYTLRFRMRVDALPPAGGTTCVFDAFVSSSSMPSMELLLHGDGRMRFYQYGDHGVVAPLMSRDLVTVGEWLTVTIVHTGAAVQLYWNGSFVTASGAPAMPASLHHVIRFGHLNPARPHSAPFIGALHTILLRNDAMTETEVTLHTGFPHISPAANVQAYYPMTEAGGDQLLDLMGSAGPAKLINDIGWQNTLSARQPFWGIGYTSGRYRETVSGLRREPIATQGTFLLNRISREGQLY